MNNVSTVHPSPPSSRSAAPVPGVDARVDALLALYRTHFTNLVRLAMLLVRDLEVAIEIVDGVFVHHAARTGAAATELPSIGALRDAVVGSSRERPPAAPFDASGGTPLLDALFALPHVQREALVLQHYGALSDDDIASAAGISYVTVAATAAEGLRALDARPRAGEDT